MIAVVAIVLILAVLLAGVLSRLPGAADRARCTSNLKALYVGLSSYTDDVGHWPQLPMSNDETSEDQDRVAEFWVDTLKPYDVPEAAWLCPGITRLEKIQRTGGKLSKINYRPTLFDAQPGTPRKWATQPWVVESGNIHGHGPLLILPDGSVHDWDTYVNEMAK